MGQGVPQQLQRWLQPGDRVLVAISGGPDSVALAHFLRGQPYDLVLGHVDHRLRSGSSGDARFVKALARGWDLPFRIKAVNVTAYARRHRLGVEEAARALRYKALFSMAKESLSVAIVTAHTANDQAETVLMNFLRGAGPSGLSGMPVRRCFEGFPSIPLIRPFLGVRKTQILRYLKRHSLSARSDPSNLYQRFARNRIRHSTLPYLERSYPGLSDRLIQTADIFRQEEDFWQSRVSRESRKTVRKDGQRITVVLPRLLRYHKTLSRRILRHVLPGLSFQDIEHVLTLARVPRQTGWIELSGPWRVKRQKTRLIANQKRMG